MNEGERMRKKKARGREMRGQGAERGKEFEVTA